MKIVINKQSTKYTIDTKLCVNAHSFREVFKEALRLDGWDSLIGEIFNEDEILKVERSRTVKDKAPQKPLDTLFYELGDHLIVKTIMDPLATRIVYKIDAYLVELRELIFAASGELDDNSDAYLMGRIGAYGVQQGWEVEFTEKDIVITKPQKQ